jgi:hypothetical protein
MFNIDPKRSIWETEDGSVAIAMKTKVSEGRLRFKAILHVEDKGIDPVDTIREYFSRWSGVAGSNTPFFVYEDGNPVLSSEKLSKEIITPYIREKGVPIPYTPYSIKTAVITALFNKGLSKEQISAFSGHSSTSNTVLKHYHDPTNQWLGHCLASIQSYEVEPPQSDEKEERIIANAAEEEEESDNDVSVGKKDKTNI